MDAEADKKTNVNVNAKLSLPWFIIAYPAIMLIRLYQFFSPLKKLILGPYATCRFYPTCSEYALQCFSRYRLPKALGKIFFRIARCNPMHPGGYDPVDHSDCQDKKHE